MGVSAFGLYLRPRSRFSHTDRLSSVNKTIEHNLLPWVPQVFFLVGGGSQGESRSGEKNITYSQNDQLPDGLIPQLVERCIGITVVKI